MRVKATAAKVAFSMRNRGCTRYRTSEAAARQRIYGKRALTTCWPAVPRFDSAAFRQYFRGRYSRVVVYAYTRPRQFVAVLRQALPFLGTQTPGISGRRTHARSGAQ